MKVFCSTSGAVLGVGGGEKHIVLLEKLRDQRAIMTPELVSLHHHATRQQVAGHKAIPHFRVEIRHACLQSVAMERTTFHHRDDEGRGAGARGFGPCDRLGRAQSCGGLIHGGEDLGMAHGAEIAAGNGDPQA